MTLRALRSIVSAKISCLRFVPSFFYRLFGKGGPKALLFYRSYTASILVSSAGLDLPLWSGYVLYSSRVLLGRSVIACSDIFKRMHACMHAPRVESFSLLVATPYSFLDVGLDSKARLTLHVSHKSN